MISEIFGLLSNLDVTGSGANRKFKVNLNKNRIGSISAFSSNSIFYFPNIVSDQCTPEEIAMVNRMLERSYASFVVACISLMPFHRIKADDTAAIEEYLAQFHQNLGMQHGSNLAMNKIFAYADTIQEAAVPLSETAIEFVNDEGDEVPKTCPKCGSKVGVFIDGEVIFRCTNKDCKEYFGVVPRKVNEAVDEMAIKSLQDLLLECWQRSRAENTDFLVEVAQEIPLNEMFNEDPIDPQLRILQERFIGIMEEKDVWGFVGEATDDMFDTEDTDTPVPNGDPAQSVIGDPNAYQDDVNHTPPGEPEVPPEESGATDGSGSLTEGSVKDAIDSIKISLESVSENKILSCSSLTKLSSLEAKLKKLKNKYTKYLNRYKKKWKENQKSGSKSKLAIRFNNIAIANPKAFMTQYGKYIKIINKRLKLVDKRRAELRDRKGLSGGSSGKLEENAILDLTQMDFDAVDFCIRSIDECLNAPDAAIFTLTEAGPNDPPEPDWKQKFLKSEKGRLQEKRVREQLQKQAREQKHQRQQKEKESELRGRELNKLKKENEQLKAGQSNPDTDTSGPEFGNPQSGYIPGRSRGQGAARDVQPFDREVFTDMEMKKANDAIPLFTNATISFIVDDTEDIHNRSVLIGIKAYVHKAPAMELINDIYNGIINKRKFLRFVKFITGEERSLTDLLFGIRELRTDALDARTGSGEWRSAFKRRRRWAKISVPYLTKEYTPNGTIVMTMNEVNFIKEQYGIDIMTPDHVRMIMDSDYLLGFVVLDQANEMVYVTYDGHGYGFQQYTYAMLEREQTTSDRMMRELYRSLSR